MVLDGNHRLAAAIFSGTEHILADVTGQLGYATELLGVDCESDVDMDKIKEGEG